MKLFHASNCIVDNPDVLHSRDFLDFGKGFYLTALEEQVRKYALRFLLHDDKAYLNCYELDDSLSGFRIKEFSSYDEDWLDFVSLCRVGKQKERYDVVSGGIADDRVFNTIDLYFSGNISKAEALGRLAFIHPNHQICILNQEVINRHLRFVKVEEIKI